MAVLLTYGTGATYALNVGQETTLVNGATTTGVAASAQFSLVLSPVGIDKTMIFQALGTFTVATANLEISSDGGTTWNALVTANDFNAAKVLKVTNLTAGCLYRWNVATFTGTSITLNGTSS